MNHFHPFEVEALRLLCTTTLGSEVVETVARDATFVSFEHSGVGYFLTVRHPMVPVARVVLSVPIVLGQVGEILGSYLVFVEHGELMLEYAGFTDVPANIRDLPVQVRVQASAT